MSNLNPDEEKYIQDLNKHRDEVMFKMLQVANFVDIGISIYKKEKPDKELEIEEIARYLFNYETRPEFKIAFKDAIKNSSVEPFEQFKDKDLAEVYSEQYFDKPLSYQGMLLGLLVAQGLLATENVPIMTLHFYAPIYMLLTVCDREPDREPEALKLLEEHIRQFDKLYGRNF